MDDSRAASNDMDLPSERPTVRSLVLRRALTPTDQLLERLTALDAEGASLRSVLVVVPSALPLPASLDVRARWVLAFVDGERSVASTLAECGLRHADAVIGMCELLARHVVAVR